MKITRNKRRITATRRIVGADEELESGAFESGDDYDGEKVLDKESSQYFSHSNRFDYSIAKDEPMHYYLYFEDKSNSDRIVEIEVDKDDYERYNIGDTFYKD